MIYKNCKILFLLIAFYAVEKDMVFAENTTNSVVKTPETSSNSRPVTSSKIVSDPVTSSEIVSAPVTSSEIVSAPIISSTTTSVPLMSVSKNSISERTSLKATEPSKKITQDDDVTELIPGYLITMKKEPMLTDYVDVKKNFHYVIYDEETGVPCTLTKMGITLTVPYETHNKRIATTTLKVPLDANVTGTCEENLSLITIAWQETDSVKETISDGENSLTMRFIKDGDIYYVQYLVVSIVLDNNNFPNATDSIIQGNSSQDLRLFPASAHLGMYICNETKEVHADPISVQIQDATIIAFNNQTDFSAKQEAYCTSEEKSEGSYSKVEVGVYIGAVLGGLLLIGLVIFTIKRSTRNTTSWNLMRNKKNQEKC